MSTIVTQNEKNIKALTIESGSIMIDLQKNDVDIKTDGSKLSININSKDSRAVILKYNDVKDALIDGQKRETYSK